MAPVEVVAYLNQSSISKSFVIIYNVKSNLKQSKAGDLERKEGGCNQSPWLSDKGAVGAFSFSALVVVCNESVLPGHGWARPRSPGSDTKGIEMRSDLINVPVMHGNIPTTSWLREGAAKLLAPTRCNGTGVIAEGSMRAVLESAGL